MNKLIRALDKIIADLDNFSATEIQAKLASHKGGLIGGAILNCHNFIRNWSKTQITQYPLSSPDVVHNEHAELSEIVLTYCHKLGEQVTKPANDAIYDYPMAA